MSITYININHHELFDIEQPHVEQREKKMIKTVYN